MNKVWYPNNRLRIQISYFKERESLFRFKYYGLLSWDLMIGKLWIGFDNLPF